MGEAAAEGGAAPLPEAVVLPMLAELNFHEWEGRPIAEVEAEEPEGHRTWKERPWDLRLGGGVAVLQDLWDRAAKSWDSMLAASDGPGPSSSSRTT
mmetsp:Transcript_171676/g.545291  ORF Transcript_171676/g.545291 Transcript_171676/m.545291 type:complete len:96 (+) Transcript_171676:377-664(+)